MVNTAALKDIIRDRGVTKTVLCEKLGINMQSLNNKLSGRNEFKISEACAMAKALFLNDEDIMGIFFGGERGAYATNEKRSEVVDG